MLRGVVGHRQDAPGDHRVVPDVGSDQLQARIGIVDGGEDLGDDAGERRQLVDAGDHLVAGDGCAGHHALR